MEENRFGPDNPDALYKRNDVESSPEVAPDDRFEDD